MSYALIEVEKKEGRIIQSRDFSVSWTKDSDSKSNKFQQNCIENNNTYKIKRDWNITDIWAEQKF